MGVRGRISRVVTVMFIDVVVYFEWLCAGRSWWGGGVFILKRMEHTVQLLYYSDFSLGKGTPNSW